ncbi:cadmium-translocating P-type ATPase [Agarivorans sp. TSD2052]|uniref:heavy metal translocating P-type ATPase n=1 Tax=Agarivorans sp. TSD2052 TaxID=2937286 RepID=UPI0020105EBC|nr:heavy metal translocating P-type ATPase [Agarivorans sp. TSD2052]UPW20541.1 cadmium-translocating P-type ATPase [Agarivorans sp. TSD2052]
MVSNRTVCFHCNEQIPSGFVLDVTILGQAQAMCCQGCAAVAKTIIDSGLDDYYKHRTAAAPSAQDLVPDELLKMLEYDDDNVQLEFVAQSEGNKEVLLSIEGISCAACAWLIEKQLSHIGGVNKIHVNSTTQRATLNWNDQQTKLSQLLSEVQKLGYKATPFQTDKQEELDRKLYRSHLLKLGVAGLATMQVMMFAIALYGDLFDEMEVIYRDYFRWVSLIMATPVLLFSAQPFYFGAYRSLKAKTLNMDVPVSIALLGAYSASLYATVKGTGEVYFESVSMFTFLLLLGRLLELRARRKASETSSNMLKLVPKLAQRLEEDGRQTKIAASQLKEGDVIVILPGETAPADGQVCFGESDFDESSLTGESLPVKKLFADTVFAGTINHEQTIHLSVQAVSQNTFIANILRLQEQAQSEKPKIATIADHIARYFVFGLLLIAALTYGFWHYYSPEDAFWITLAVLVATCPCALSLATPAALTAATHNLSKNGLLVKRGHVLESLAKLSAVISDKTGTLTEGKLQINSVTTMGNDSEQQILNFAAALERQSSHPIAQAFAKFRLNNASEIKHHTGLGLEGRINGNHFLLGKASFCQQAAVEQPGMLELVMLKNEQLVARIYLSDTLKSDAKQFADGLAQRNISLSMLTGDDSAQVPFIAEQLNITEVISGALPQDKLAALKRKVQGNPHIVMLGDGVNDGPVLAAAPLSIAMGLGTDIAKSSADAVLLGSKLSTLLAAIDLAKLTRKIIAQNLAWALGYNALILPLAVAGIVTPYMAAIGMSLSSLAVLTNSLRLNKQ